MNSPEEICNLSLSRLGVKTDIKSITDPKTPEERACASWYNISRRIVLKKLAPNCALDRDIVAKISTAPKSGYAFAYQKPAKCLKVLGIGDVQDKENNYSVEKNLICTDEDYSGGMPVRFIYDLEEIAKMDDEVILAIVAELSEKIAMQITQEPEALTAMTGLIKKDQSNASALNAQENRPVRINRSKFKMAKNGYDTRGYNKK